MKVELYYIQDTRQYVGNSVLWWQLGGGYTTNIEKAEKFTKEQAIGICKRETDRAWLCSHVDKHIKKHVDMQYLDVKYSRKWKRKEKASNIKTS